MGRIQAQDELLAELGPDLGLGCVGHLQGIVRGRGSLPKIVTNHSSRGVPALWHGHWGPDSGKRPLAQGRGCTSTLAALDRKSHATQGPQGGGAASAVINILR